MRRIHDDGATDVALDGISRKGSKMGQSFENKLIYDIGVNHGEDTLLYLRKGFKVIGIEANPLLAKENEIVLHDYIASGQLQIKNCGIMKDSGTLPFYVNLDCDHWSSFFEDSGTRNGSRYEILEIDCISIVDLLSQYGCPYYMKIDVEGADRIILDSMKEAEAMPEFISVEEFGVETLYALRGLGYDMFSLRPQQDKSWCNAKTETLEGTFVEQHFDHRCSGLFGRDVPEWLSFDAARTQFHQTVRDDNNNWLPPPGEFYDIHACSRRSLDRGRA